MISRAFLAVVAASSVLLAVPAAARRTAIDERDGVKITASLGGYCDYNGDDCGAGFVLPYMVKIGGDDFTNIVTVHGNGVLTFGASIDFYENFAVREQIDQGIAPALTDYARTLVSGGQNVGLDWEDPSVFMQSARIGFNAANGAIIATWFTCYRPTGPNMCPESDSYSLTLTPRRGGFAGHFSSVGGGDRGYVSDGAFTAVGSDFFLAAEFDRIAPGVPEPASWSLMIAGFGMAGVALRRRNTRTIVAHA